MIFIQVHRDHHVRYLDLADGRVRSVRAVPPIDPRATLAAAEAVQATVEGAALSAEMLPRLEALARLSRAQWEQRRRQA